MDLIRVNTQLTPAQKEGVRQLAFKFKKSEAAVIRQAVEEFLIIEAVVKPHG